VFAVACYACHTKVVAVTSALAAVNIYTPSIIGDLVNAVQSLTSTTPAATHSHYTSVNTTLAVLAPCAIKLFSCFLVQGVLTCIDIALVSKLGEAVAVRMRRKLARSLIVQDIAFFDAVICAFCSSARARVVVCFCRVCGLIHFCRFLFNKRLNGEILGRLTTDVAEFKVSY
jgi:ABC-type multidrug transport system fused ATPase/permease subunit